MAEIEAEDEIVEKWHRCGMILESGDWLPLWHLIGNHSKAATSRRTPKWHSCRNKK